MTYQKGFEEGWKAGIEYAMTFNKKSSVYQPMREGDIMPLKKRKKPQKGKAKLLTTMTAPKWNKYKKGSGKKTYVQIRAQVSRSLEYKRACKRKGFK